MDDVDMDVLWPKRPRTEETSPAETLALPVYQPEAKALDVFENECFHGTEQLVDIFRKERERKYITGHDCEGSLSQVHCGKRQRRDLTIALRCLKEPVLKLSLEDRRHGMKTINFSMNVTLLGGIRTNSNE